MAGRGPELLQGALPEWLPQQRWFGAKTRKIQSVRVVDWVELSEAQAPDGTAKGTDIRGQVAIRLALFFVELPTPPARLTRIVFHWQSVIRSMLTNRGLTFRWAFSPRLQHIWANLFYMMRHFALTSATASSHSLSETQR